jgi:hypothetical protein
VHDSVNALHSLVLFQLASSSNALFASVSGQFLEILVCIGGSIIGSGARQEPAQPPVVCVCVCVCWQYLDGFGPVVGCLSAPQHGFKAV